MVVRAILFPYSNKIVTNQLDGQLNRRFGTEFTKILEKTVSIIKTQMRGQRGDKEQSAGEMKFEFSKFQLNSSTNFVIRLSGLMGCCDLVQLYSTINTRCIEFYREENMRVNRYFVRLTQILVEFKENLKKLQVTILMNGKPVNTQLWSLYLNDAEE